MFFSALASRIKEKHQLSFFLKMGCSSWGRLQFCSYPALFRGFPFSSDSIKSLQEMGYHWLALLAFFVLRFPSDKTKKDNTICVETRYCIRATQLEYHPIQLLSFEKWNHGPFEFRVRCLPEGYLLPMSRVNLVSGHSLIILGFHVGACNGWMKDAINWKILTVKRIS